MKKTVTSKLIRRGLILAVMVMCLVFVASSDKYAEQVAAAPCCEGCPGGGDPEGIYGDCAISCYSVLANGGTTAQYNDCVDYCQAQGYYCYNRCYYCSGGGPPGGGCNSNSDCPPNQFCAADNQCHSY